MRGGGNGNRKHSSRGLPKTSWEERQRSEKDVGKLTGTFKKKEGRDPTLGKKRDVGDRFISNLHVRGVGEATKIKKKFYKKRLPRGGKNGG